MPRWSFAQLLNFQLRQRIATPPHRGGRRARTLFKRVNLWPFLAKWESHRPAGAAGAPAINSSGENREDSEGCDVEKCGRRLSGREGGCGYCRTGHERTSFPNFPTAGFRPPWAGKPEPMGRPRFAQEFLAVCYKSHLGFARR